MNLKSALRWLPVLLTCWILGACAALPDVQSLSSTVDPNATPTVHGSKGALTDERARAVLAKRWSKGTLDLQAEAASEAPGTSLLPLPQPASRTSEAAAPAASMTVRTNAESALRRRK